MQRPEHHSRRVLVVDDSPAYRRILTEALGAIAGIEVAGVAANLAIARRKIQDGQIDLVTLDVEMEGESGLELLAWMSRRERPLPAILVTGQQSAELRSEVDAILLGATSLV